MSQPDTTWYSKHVIDPGDHDGSQHGLVCRNALIQQEDTMGIFDKIKSAIFGSAKASETPAAASAGAAPAKGAASGTPRSAPSAAAPTKTAAASAPGPAPATAAASMSQVDVEAVLTQRAAQNKQKLDWRRSIVDLMKLLELDSSLAARKELAKELGYSGDTDDSASMNVWLHKQVMQKLAASGGKVPELFQEMFAATGRRH
jgi:hypothetical protein